MEDTREKKKIKAETGFIVAVLLIIVAVIEGTTYRKIIPANQPKVVVILPGDINDQSWNKGNYEGILANQNKDKKIDLEYQSNVEEKDFEAVIRRYAEDNYNLIILAGSQFEEVVSSVSGDYPKVDFCILNGRSASGKNTFSVYPKEEEASHLAGIIGGNLTKTEYLVSLPVIRMRQWRPCWISMKRMFVSWLWIESFRMQQYSGPMRIVGKMRNLEKRLQTK